MSKPEISVIVCAHNQVFIHEFVASVKNSIGVTYEIIVISSDPTLTSIPGCFVTNGPPLPAAKRNMGARLAKAPLLAFFDDDTAIDPDCLLQYKVFMDTHPFAGMAYGKLHKGDEPHRFDEAGGYLTSTGFIWSRAGQNIVDTGQYDNPVQIFAGKSASCIIRTNLFNLIGGFDEDFGILGEESDLSWRVWLNGQQVWYVPQAHGIHWFNTKRKITKRHYTSSRVQYNGSRNYCTMLVKNLEGANLCRILPVHLVIWFTAGLAMIGTLKIREGVNIWRGLYYVGRNIGKILAKRKRVQRARRVSDAAIWPSIYRQAPRGYYKQRIMRYLTFGLHG